MEWAHSHGSGVQYFGIGVGSFPANKGRIGPEFLRKIAPAVGGHICRAAIGADLLADSTNSIARRCHGPIYLLSRRRSGYNAAIRIDPTFSIDSGAWEVSVVAFFEVSVACSYTSRSSAIVRARVIASL